MSRRRARGLATILVGAGLAASSACVATALSFRAVPEMNGVRTADGGRSILISYVGGGCDEAARTHVAEGAQVVTVTAAIPTAGDSCSSVGYARVATFTLSRPLGHRLVRNGPSAKPVPAFDGSILTTPAWVPSGYVQRSNAQGPDVDGSWTRIWQPAVARNPSDNLMITQAPHPLPALTGSPVAGRHTVDGVPATVTDDPSNGELAVQWIDPTTRRGDRVAARLAVGYRLTLTVADLLHVADSLPAAG